MDSVAANSTPRGQRARRTCTECHRRKIKCDKNVPCHTCIKRGLEDSCSRSADDEAGVRASPLPRRPESQQPSQSQLIERLLNRVSSLESALQEKASSPGPVLTTTIEPSNSTAQPFRAANTTVVPSIPGSPESAADAADAATVLEFLAWGRRKDQSFNETPENDSGPGRYGISRVETSMADDTLASSVKMPQVELLGILLPNKNHVFQLIEYHDRCLLWYHLSYMGMTFDQEVKAFYAKYDGNIRHPEVNLQWVALLFSVLTGSITCSTQQTALSWGFKDAERASLSKQWFHATVTCLNLSDYMESHTVYSVQAISTLTISAHLLGLSNSQSVLLAAATKIAQATGLHRLGEESEISDFSSAPEKIIGRRKRETGRRVWCQLCTQDWFSIPFSEVYLLNSVYFDTAKPLNCEDSDMLVLAQDTPTITSYCNYRYDIASLIPKLQDAMATSNTLYTKYEQVLSYDEKMRQLTTAYMPTFLYTNAPVASNWPVYVPWARRSLTICAAHKIIMIHRKFLVMSFTNIAFAFTRRTCVAAAKTILKEVQADSDKDGPVLWIDHAFTVAAGIILCLDAFHRKPGEPAYVEHKKLTEEAVEYLSHFNLSMIALRGTKLLSFLTDELAAAGDREARTASDYSRKRRASTDDSPGSHHPEKRVRVFDFSKFMQSISVNQQITPPVTRKDSNSAAETAWDAFTNMFPPQTGFGGQHLFDNFFEFEE